MLKLSLIIFLINCINFKVAESFSKHTCGKQTRATHSRLEKYYDDNLQQSIQTSHSHHQQWATTSPSSVQSSFGSKAFNRRGFVASILTTVATSITSSASIASDENVQLSASQVAALLHAVPTFTLVDRRGVPFMVVGEDAKLTAYFFTTYDEAKRILVLASKSADRAIKEAVKAGEEVGDNPWKNARVSTVPLDFAVTLASRGKVAGSFFRVAPSEDDIRDALSIDKSSDDLAEGKVPLFYFEDMTLPSLPSEGKKIPLYFQKSQLLRQWKEQNPKDDFPQVKVTELFSVLTEMVKPNGTDEDVKSLVFIPPKESDSRAKECLRKGGKEEAFKLGERIVVL